MKRKFLTVLLLLFVSAGFSQTQLGIKGGLGGLRLFQHDEYHPSNIDGTRLNYPVSVFICSQQNKWLGITAEIEFLTRNYSLSEYSGGLGGGTYADYTIKANYFDIIFYPRFTIGSKIKFLIFPGWYFAFPVQSSIKGTVRSFQGGQNDRYQYLDGSAKGYIGKFEMGGLVGIGVDIPVYKELSVIAQGSISMIIAPTSNNWADIGYWFFQSRLEAGLAYTFKSKKKDTSAPK